MVVGSFAEYGQWEVLKTTNISMIKFDGKFLYLLKLHHSWGGTCKTLTIPIEFVFKTIIVDEEEVA